MGAFSPGDLRFSEAQKQKTETLQHFWCSEAENAVRSLFWRLESSKKSDLAAFSASEHQQCCKVSILETHKNGYFLSFQGLKNKDLTSIAARLEICNHFSACSARSICPVAVHKLDCMCQYSHCAGRILREGLASGHTTGISLQLCP